MTVDDVIDTLIALDPMADLPRTGWLLRGVNPAESLAAHSHGVAVVAALLVDLLRERGVDVDGERVLRLALIHDAPEAKTGDIPMPSKTAELSTALDRLEDDLARQLLPDDWQTDWQEVSRGESLPARIVKAADKIQMMIKVLVYERTRGADLEDFWQNPGNLPRVGVDVADEIFDAIFARARRDRP